MLVEVLDAQSLPHALTKGVFEIQKTAVANVKVVNVRAKHLPIHLQLAVFRQQVPVKARDISVPIVVLYGRGE